MLRKVLFQAHWFVGITLGAVLSMLGITGAPMAGFGGRRLYAQRSP